MSQQYVCKVFSPNRPKEEFTKTSNVLAEDAMHDKLRGYYHTSKGAERKTEKGTIIHIYYRQNGEEVGTIERIERDDELETWETRARRNEENARGQWKDGPSAWPKVSKPR